MQSSFSLKSRKVTRTGNAAGRRRLFAVTCYWFSSIFNPRANWDLVSWSPPRLLLPSPLPSPRPLLLSVSATQLKKLTQPCWQQVVRARLRELVRAPSFFLVILFPSDPVLNSWMASGLDSSSSTSIAEDTSQFVGWTRKRKSSSIQRRS